ncbi:MAG TPA: hypothetical protein VGD63_17425 [Steroidobacteraceae bacterium]
MFGRLVGRIDAGEMLQFTGPGLLVKAFHVTLLGDLKRRFHINFDEFARMRHLADHAPFGPEGRNKGGQHNEPGVGHQLRDLTDAANILDPIGIGEP